MGTIKEHCGNCARSGSNWDCTECEHDRVFYNRYTSWVGELEDPVPCEPAKPEATKHDLSKPRYDLIPPDVLYGLAQMYTLGAEKYGDYNWERGMNWHRVYAALQRHANKWWRGEAYDQEDGQHHLLSVIWCATTLYAYEARGLGNDTRPNIGDFDPDFWRKPDAERDKATPAAQ